HVGEPPAGLRVDRLGRAVVPLDGLLDDLVAEQVGQVADDAVGLRYHLAAVEPQVRHQAPDPLLDDVERAVTHLLTGRLDRAAGDVRLPGSRRRSAAADTGVLGVDDDAVHAELGARDLLLDGD